MDDETVCFYDSSDKDSCCTEVYDVIRSVIIKQKVLNTRDDAPEAAAAGAGEGAGPGAAQAQESSGSEDQQLTPQKENCEVPADESTASPSQKSCDNFTTPNVSEDAIQKADSSPEANNEDWQQREIELLKKIEELEKVKTEAGSDGVKIELKIRTDECELLRARIKSLETELAVALSRPGANNKELVERIKQQHDDLLTKARGMIFDKTKIVKNQELQIAALTSQVASLKDVNTITKDLLEIRNAELKNLEERLEAMDARFKAEKQRHSLVLQRAETSANINVDLRKEYETQLALFKELREKYDQRVQVLTAENERLKEALKGGPSG